MSNNNKILSIDPLIDKIMNQNSDTESDYKNNIPELYQINGQKINTESKYNFYNQFKPFDKIIIRPLVDSSFLIMKHLGFKSKIIGFLTLFSYSVGGVFSYNSKDNLAWAFMYLGFLISFFDKLYINNVDNKYRLNEMLIILIKLTIYVILSIIFRSYILTDNNCKNINNNIYMLILILIVNTVLSHHTEKIYLKNNIKSRKLLMIKKINIIILLIFTTYIIYQSLDESNNNLNNDIFDLFIFNDKNKN